MKRKYTLCSGAVLSVMLGLLAIAITPRLANAQEPWSCGQEPARVATAMPPGTTAMPPGTTAVPPEAALESDAPMLRVVGDVARPLALSAAGFRDLPRRRVVVEDRDGPAEFEGVPLLELLRVAGVPVESLRGAQAATVIVAEARDGYRAAYSLAELDETFSGRLFILADRRGEAALGEGEGPLRVVAEGETRRSRWIREVRCLRVVVH